MFLNYDNKNGLRLLTYRNNGVSCWDIEEFIGEIALGHECTSNIDLQSLSDALCDLRAIGMYDSGVENLYYQVKELLEDID